MARVKTPKPPVIEQPEKLSVDDYLMGIEPVKFTWGISDCVKFAMGWLVARGYDDTTLAYGEYDEARGREIIEESGGFVQLLDGLFAALEVTEEPQRGDIGLVQPFSMRDPAVGIYLGNRWAFRSLTGVAAVKAKPIKIWRVR